MDTQITHIIVEISKFEKTGEALKTDLDKLIYTMKNLEHIKGLDELPKELTEDWTKIALEKVDTSQMTPEQHMHFEMMLARNGSILAMERDEKKAMKAESKAEGEEIGQKRKAISAAKKLKEFGVEVSIIAASTGLTEEETSNL